MQGIDFMLVEDICLFKYNYMIDQPIMINLRDVELKGEYIEAHFSVGNSSNLETMSIRFDEYQTLLRQKRLKDLGI
jgi:hypothetical protein